MKDRREKPRDKAWIPPRYELADVLAIKALMAGNANDRQQKRALDWIRNVASGREGFMTPFRSDEDGGDRETAFMLGRQFVGQAIDKMCAIPGAVIEQMQQEAEHDR